MVRLKEKPLNLDVERSLVYDYLVISHVVVSNVKKNLYGAENVCRGGEGLKSK
jgi:hypothetical protein